MFRYYYFCFSILIFLFIFLTLSITPASNAIAQNTEQLQRLEGVEEAASSLLDRIEGEEGMQEQRETLIHIKERASTLKEQLREHVEEREERLSEEEEKLAEALAALLEEESFAVDLEINIDVWEPVTEEGGRFELDFEIRAEEESEMGELHGEAKIEAPEDSIRIDDFSLIFSGDELYGKMEEVPVLLAKDLGVEKEDIEGKYVLLSEDIEEDLFQELPPCEREQLKEIMEAAEGVDVHLESMVKEALREGLLIVESSQETFREGEVATGYTLSTDPRRLPGWLLNLLEDDPEHEEFLRALFPQMSVDTEKAKDDLREAEGEMKRDDFPSFYYEEFSLWVTDGYPAEVRLNLEKEEMEEVERIQELEINANFGDFGESFHILPPSDYVELDELIEEVAPDPVVHGEDSHIEQQMHQLRNVAEVAYTFEDGYERLQRLKEENHEEIERIKKEIQDVIRHGDVEEDDVFKLHVSEDHEDYCAYARLASDPEKISCVDSTGWMGIVSLEEEHVPCHQYPEETEIPTCQK